MLGIPQDEGFLRLFILEQDRELGEFNCVETKGRGPNMTSDHSHILKAEMDVVLKASGPSHSPASECWHELMSQMKK